MAVLWCFCVCSGQLGIEWCWGICCLPVDTGMPWDVNGRCMHWITFFCRLMSRLISLLRSLHCSSWTTFGWSVQLCVAAIRCRLKHLGLGACRLCPSRTNLMLSFVLFVCSSSPALVGMVPFADIMCSPGFCSSMLRLWSAEKQSTCV
jgi:hypothetical protein